jgi:hypothetical protein
MPVRAVHNLLCLAVCLCCGSCLAAHTARPAVPAFTAYPSSAGLPAVIVDSTPAWIRADSSFDQTHGGFLRGVLAVSFNAGTSLSLKQAALDSVMGTYVGGMPLSGWDGVYYVGVADDGTGAQLQAAIVVLMRQPQVLTASLVFRLAPGARRPTDGVGGIISERLSLVVEATSQTGTVLAVAPNLRPTWFNDDSSWTSDSLALKRVLAVDFVAGAALVQKQAAIDSVQGTVIGGAPWLTAPDEGTYYIGVSNATTLAQLMAAVAILERQSGVSAAVPLLRAIPAGGSPMKVPAVSFRASPVVKATQRGRVPAAAPDSTPAWFLDDSNWTSDLTLKRIAEVKFQAGASTSQRQAAIDSVGGMVVGGYHLPNAPEGTYYVLIPTATSESALLAALQKLERQPGVKDASFHARLKPTGLRQVDGAGSQKSNWTAVPAVPPDSTPAWFANDSSYLDGGNGVMKRVIVLRFSPSATQAQRQAAVDSVSGTVVGGSRMRVSDGFYLVYVPAAVTVQGLDSLIVILERQPFVDMATYNAKFRDFHLRPVDGVGWQLGDWSLRPGATAVANTWLARVAAPLAWGGVDSSISPRVKQRCIVGHLQ